MNDETEDIEIIHKAISIKDKLELIINQIPYEDLRRIRTKDFLNSPIAQQTNLSLIESSGNYEIPKLSRIDNRWDRNLIEIPLWINRNQVLYVNKDKTRLNIKYDDGNSVTISCFSGLFTRTDYQFFLSSFRSLRKTNEGRLYLLFASNDLLKEIGKEDDLRYYNRVKNYIKKLREYIVTIGNYKCKKIDGREIEFESIENINLIKHYFRLSEKQNVKNNYHIIFLSDEFANLMLSNLENKFFIYLDKNLFRIKGDIALRIYNEIKLSGKKQYWIDLKNKKYMKDKLLITPSRMSEKYIVEALEELKKLNLYDYDKRLNKYFIEEISKDTDLEEKEEIENFIRKVFKWAERDCFAPLNNPKENKKYLRRVLKDYGLETIENIFYKQTNRAYPINPYEFFYKILPDFIEKQKEVKKEIKEYYEEAEKKEQNFDFKDIEIKKLSKPVTENIEESDVERTARLKEEQKKRLKELIEKTNKGVINIKK